jgi:hypothetical protein
MLYEGIGPCTWHVMVRNTWRTEIDFPSDLWDEVECGAPRTAIHENGSDGWTCESGHHHWEYGSPNQASEEADEALAERYAMDYEPF